MLDRGEPRSTNAIRRDGSGHPSAVATQLSGPRGFSVIEIMVVLSIFSIILAGVFNAYLAQLKNTTREYRFAEADIDLGIARNIIERDIAMAGYGLAEDYGAVAGFALPVAAQATNGNPDTLTLMGTALGTRSRAAQGWTYMTAVAAGVPTFQAWMDAREDLRTDPGGVVTRNDAVILMEPSTKRLLAQGGAWLFRYNGSPATPTTLPGGVAYSAPTIGTLAYGLQRADDAAPAQPFYAVRYALDNGLNNPANCAPGTARLLRAESTANTAPTGGDTILACVRDLEVAFGLDTNGDGAIDIWDDGGVAAAGYTNVTLRRNMKQVRVFLLVQSGNYDPQYTYPTNPVRVGDGIVGRDVTLTAQQLNYRWKLMNVNVTPRNVR